MSSDEIKKLLGNEKLVIGTDRIMKGLRNSAVSKVFVASNTSSESLNEIKHFASISGAVVETLNMTNEELGAFCKKPFSVSVLGISK